jgi:hypothetical protein
MSQQRSPGHGASRGALRRLRVGGIGSMCSVAYSTRNSRSPAIDEQTQTTLTDSSHSGCPTFFKMSLLVCRPENMASPCVHYALLVKTHALDNAMCAWMLAPTRNQETGITMTGSCAANARAAAKTSFAWKTTIALQRTIRRQRTSLLRRQWKTYGTDKTVPMCLCAHVLCACGASIVRFWYI